MGFLINFARFIAYFSILRMVNNAGTSYFKTGKVRVSGMIPHLVRLGAAMAVLWYYNEEIIQKDFTAIQAAFVATIERGETISYGVGLACGYFEGYLSNVLQSSGNNSLSFVESLEIMEARESLIFPVKRLFVVVNKSLYCPPDLTQFNRQEPQGIPFLELARPDEHRVGTRVFSVSTYKINRPGRPSVYVCAESASPLHTLHRIRNKRSLYPELVDVSEKPIREDFCSQLQRVISRSPDCRDKCELVFFDDSDPNQNLANILLTEVEKLEPNFEEMIGERLH